MHTPPSESSILRDLLDKEIRQNSVVKEKLENILGDLDVECDVSADRTWSDQYHCGIHGTFFKDHKKTYVCPVGDFAQELKKRHE
jgi:hypothetical protein